jgi:glycerophosphoryl diester phosphodiesterase
MFGISRRRRSVRYHCDAMEPPAIIAHRTCPKHAPENSLAGIREAAAQGADGVEVDLRLSIDGKPFLMHDNTMGRTAGLPLPLEIVPSFIIRRLRIRGSDERIPSLGAVFDALPPGMTLAVDVKTPWAVHALVREVRRRGVESRVLAWCTSAMAAAYVAKQAPEIETGYLSGARSVQGKRRFIDRAVAIGAKAISAHWTAIDGEFIAAAHAKGLRVYAWHQSHGLVAPKLKAGLDGLITDYPRDARAAYAGID